MTASETMEGCGVSDLNSTRPAIRNFLDDLEANNPGAKAALAAAITAYRITTLRLASIVAAAVGAALDGLGADFLFVINTRFQRPKAEAEQLNPNRRHWLIDRNTNQCVD